MGYNNETQLVGERGPEIILPKKSFWWRIKFWWFTKSFMRKRKKTIIKINKFNIDRDFDKELKEAIDNLSR